MPKDERELLISALKETMGLVSIPEHAVRRLELMNCLRERGFHFTDYQFTKTLREMIREGRIKKCKSGQQTYYWFVEAETKS